MLKKTITLTNILLLIIAIIIIGIGIDIAKAETPSLASLMLKKDRVHSALKLDRFGLQEKQSLALDNLKNEALNLNGARGL